MADKKNFQITDNDKEWVEENFDWLIKVYGYPSPYYKPILFTEDFFPQTIGSRQTAIEPLLEDLCRLFNIDREKISFETEEDIRDTYGTPYEFQGQPFECELEMIPATGGYSYKLYFAKALLRHPKRLLFNCVYHFIKIRLAEDKVRDDDNEDSHLFIYLVGIYMGYGVLLSQTMTDEGRHNDGFWETKWNYTSEIPLPVMAYAMALFYRLIEEKNAEWKKFLPTSFRNQYDKATEFIYDSPNTLFNKQELSAQQLFHDADMLSVQNDFDSSILTYQKALFLTGQDCLKAAIYNNIGYALLRKGEYQKSIPNFQKVLEINPGYGYANDNLGFAFIMSGDPESGKYYLTIALQTGNNDKAYSYRNAALYHQKRGEMNLADENFRKAFDSISIPVDLLEYFYARFLFEIGEKEKGMNYLKIAVEKDEPEAIAFIKEITQPNTSK